MKKLISVMLLLAMVLGLFAGCGKDKGAPAGLTSAVEYLTSMYQTAGKDEAILISADQDVLKSVVVDGVSYAVEWTVAVTEGDTESVTVSESTKENHVKLDIPLHSGSDILFTATATVSDDQGNTQAVTFNYKVEGVKLAGEGMTMEELVEAAYALDEDQALEGLAVLTGKVTVINTPYDDGYKNLTCTIVVADRTDLPIKCYRLKGEGAETLAEGDTITVSGTLKNYRGTIEFDAGCVIDELIKGTDEIEPAPIIPREILLAAYALEDNASLPYVATLTGTIQTVDDPYDAGYQNITVTIVVEGCEDMPIKCYRMKGEGADRLAVGDVITVTGKPMKYNGTVEFAQGCTLDAINEGGLVVPPEDQLKIVDEAYTLQPDASLSYTATLTGLITEIKTAYDPTFQNVSVVMTVAGREQKPILCYRIKGNGADLLTVGDTITVSGIIKNYNGTIEFDAGSALLSFVKGNNLDLRKPDTEVGIVDQAFKLQPNQALPYLATLSGKVTYVKELYNTQYKNITVVIQVPGRENLPLTCYRMKGNNADKIAIGDDITVEGTIKNYNGSIQFDAGCTMTAYKSNGGKPPVAETDPQKIIDMAYALGENQEMTYDVTLTGKVTDFVDAYTEKYKSISVMFAVPGRESKPVQLFGLKGDGVTSVAVGDTLTVVGRLKNYYGDVEMTNCTITSRIPGGGKPPVVETNPSRILAAGANLANDKELPYDVTLSGTVVSVDQAYNSDYKNVTVTISVDGTNQNLKLYRLKGDGVEKLVMSDKVTVEGRIKKYNDKLELVNCTMTKRVPGNVVPETDYKAIVDEAYALEQGKQLGYSATLVGKIVELKAPYDETFKNMTVVIAVTGREDKPIECYRMKGDDVGNHLCVGDTITVTGVIKNYNGTIEFDAGCEMTKRVSGGAVKPNDPKQIVDAAFALGENAVLPYFATLTGTVKSIDQPYSDQYKNVTVTITVQGTNGPKDIQCYRLKGDTASSVAVGNTITVTGAIKRFVRDKDGVHEDKIEFDSGCVINSLQKSGTLYVVPDPVVSEVELNAGGIQPLAELDAAKILTEAYALAENESLSYTATLTGKITSIKDPYNSSFKNISVWMEVAGHADKPILAYRVAGEGAENLLVDDIITVTGTITNYKGTVEFKQGCTLDKVVSGGGSAPVAPSDPKQIVAEAYALAEGATLPYKATLTGKITEIGAYNETYGDLTLKIVVEGKEFECYALKGENLLELAVGDTITVTGTIKNYYGKVEFDKPTLDAVVKGDAPQPAAKVYYLFGYINGKDYACKDDEANMGEYRFVDGKIVATFTVDSYVGVKTEGNGVWYMTQGWLGTDSKTATLYDSNTLSNADKLFVPANTEFVFTITENADGSLTLTYTENLPGDENDAPTTPAEIVDAAYALPAGQSLEGTYTLTGKIMSVDYSYSETSGDITVTMQVPGRESKPIKCYRLKGTGVDVIGAKDTITVTGVLKNYNGTIEFDAGCTLVSYEKNQEPSPEAPTDPKKIVDEAFALAPGDSLPYTAKLTGKIVSVDDAYSEQYKNITVTIEVEGTNGPKRLVCYRMKGTGVEGLSLHDTITVEGTIIRYVKTDAETGEVTDDKVEFSLPTLVSVMGNTPNPGLNPDPDDDDKTKTPAQIVEEAFALKSGESLSYEATLTGKITSVDYAYNATNGDITVSFTVEGKTLKCYRMTGTGVDKIKVGDTITVKGKIKNYNGTVEFDQPVLVSVTAGTTGNNGGSNPPETGDYSMMAPIIIMVMASAALVVLSKKKFYC